MAASEVHRAAKEAEERKSRLEISSGTIRTQIFYSDQAEGGVFILKTPKFPKFSTKTARSCPWTFPTVQKTFNFNKVAKICTIFDMNQIVTKLKIRRKMSMISL